MEFAKLFLVIIFLFVIYVGVRTVFDKDWAWERQETLNRRRGITESEHTPEWETTSNLTGWFMIIVGIIALIVSLSIS